MAENSVDQILDISGLLIRFFSGKDITTVFFYFRYGIITQLTKNDLQLTD